MVGEERVVSGSLVGEADVCPCPSCGKDRRFGGELVAPALDKWLSEQDVQPFISNLYRLVRLAYEAGWRESYRVNIITTDVVEGVKGGR